VAPRCAAANHHFVGAVHAPLTNDVGDHLTERLFSARIVTEKRILEAEMKALIFASIIIALSAVASAEAKGCLKGAAVGGVAGHYSGHHGLLGAAAGCVIGRHEANKRDRLQKNQIDQPNRDLRNGEERL
jgi:hypothetical protein